MFTVRKVCVYNQKVVCLQSGRYVFTVRKLCEFTVMKLCVHSQEVVCSQGGVHSQSGKCVFTVRKVCVHS